MVREHGHVCAAQRTHEPARAGLAGVVLAGAVPALAPLVRHRLGVAAVHPVAAVFLDGAAVGGVIDVGPALVARHHQHAPPERAAVGHHLDDLGALAVGVTVACGLGAVMRVGLEPGVDPPLRALGTV